MRKEEPVLWKTKSGLIHPLQIAWGLVYILCISAFLMSWLQLEVGVEFTSGKPERSELIMETELDAELESAEFRIEKATPFVTWIFSRDSLQEDEREDAEYQGPQSRVENTRALTIVTLISAAAISDLCTRPTLLPGNRSCSCVPIPNVAPKEIYSELESNGITSNQI